LNKKKSLCYIVFTYKIDLMKVLFIGDIFGKTGRRMLRCILPNLKKEREIDLVIANVENSAHGRGATPKILEELRRVGVDFFTSGNHIWQNRTIYETLADQNSDLIRPANYPPEAEGFGAKIIETKKTKVLIMNLIGRVFMKEDFDCPFRRADEILKEQEGKYDFALIDFHAEATSEKIAFKHYLNGKIAVIVGTHTHIPTADAQITKEGTAYVTDLGMVGSRDSVIGLEKNAIIQKFLTQTPIKHEVEEYGKIEFDSILVEIDEKTGKSVSIEQIILFDEF